MIDKKQFYAKIKHHFHLQSGILAGIPSWFGWYLLDSVGVGGTLSALHTLKKSRTSAIHQNTQTLFGGVNLFWFTSALPALTLWGYASELKSIIHHAHNIKSFFTAGATVAAAPAMAASSFAFAMGMFVMAGNAAYKWYRAEQKANPMDLFQDRLEKYNALSKKIKDTPNDAAEKQSLIDKQTKMEAQVRALYHYCNTQNTSSNSDQQNRFNITKDKNIKIINSIATESTSATDIALARYLILKQQHKIEASKFDFVANLMGGIGATFAGLAVLSIFFCPPAGMLLAFAAAAFFSVSAGMKTRQLLDQRAQSKNIEKAFENAKKSNTNLTKEEFEEKLIIDFFGRFKENKHELKFSEIEKQLSDADKKEIMVMEVKFFSLINVTEEVNTIENNLPHRRAASA